MGELSHFDESGASHMVNVGGKAVTQRMARAEAILEMKPETLRVIRSRVAAKGDVIEVARIAGIMAARKTSDLIPLCHPLNLDSVSVAFEFPDDSRMRIESRVSCEGKTGVEMEALVSVTTAALTVYDMCKSIDREMQVTLVRLLEKSGGSSGHFLRSN
ncbi:MAG: cyclic pyranopterin monophosphate synthase MoaC [Planctomyces sp.]|jgi:cyclic pyranopterin phosphate synthase